MSHHETGRFHALLIGIENYENYPLSGCINDIDQVQSFLIGKLELSAPCIRRLEAPRDPLGDNPIMPECAPTYDNLVAALRQLARDPVQNGDRVLVYYSGHGSSEYIPQAECYFEGLVPLDHEEKGLLFDVELNKLLQDIADRSGDLTVILDCCHSAGATRDIKPAQMDGKVRFLPIDRRMAGRARRSAARLRSLAAGRAQQLPQIYTVVAACHADEVAAECRIPQNGGKPRGLFSHSLFELLSRVEPPALAQLRWSDIWEQLKAAVGRTKPGQRPVLLGPRERRVFGGPWRPQDTGYAITQRPDSSYLVAAGSLAGLGEGAQLAVYGPHPALFPPLNSEADRQARVGVLVLDCVHQAQATASVFPIGAPAFAVPAAARGRLIKQGAPSLLQVAVAQNLAPEVRRFLDENTQWDRFTLLPEMDPMAECHVGQYENGDIWIGDDLTGPGAPNEPTAPGPMGRVRRGEALDAQDLAIGLRAGLNHYAQYVIPLRVCRNGGFTLPEGAVDVKVLDCTVITNPKNLECNAELRREARRDQFHPRYVINSGTPVVFHLHNPLATDLYVFLLLCNLEGQIEFLDGDVVLNARSGKIFWHQNIIGKPFELVCHEDQDWGIDRLIIIATDQKGMDLRVLAQKLTMNEAISEAISAKSIKSTAKNPPALRWTAVQTLIQVGDRLGSG